MTNRCFFADGLVCVSQQMEKCCITPVQHFFFAFATRFHASVCRRAFANNLREAQKWFAPLRLFISTQPESVTTRMRAKSTKRRNIFTFTLQFFFMQLFLSAPADAAKRPGKFSVWWTLRQAASKRTAIGFTIGEAVLWFGFVVMWPTILGSLYFFSGMFESGSKAMPINKFIFTSAVVSFVKAVVIIPFWWLFFRKLVPQLGWKSLPLHLPLGSLYAIIAMFIIYQAKTRIMYEPYPYNFVVGDTYNLLTAYFMNFLVFHAYNFWLSGQRQHKREQELRELSFQNEINALKTQIEPHFLFNTLNSISATVPPTLEKTRVLIAQLADTFRYALRVNESRFVPLSDELDFIKTWLALEQQRFGPRLQVQYNIDPEVLCAQVPPMLVQPLVENALNHGIAHRLEGGIVTIICKKEKNAVFIAVQDTGAGYAGDLSQIMNKGVGLSNTARRLQLLYNQQIQVERQPQGLCFSFFVPVKPLHETERINY